jgi:hypothetical protein
MAAEEPLPTVCGLCSSLLPALPSSPPYPLSSETQTAPKDNSAGLLLLKRKAVESLEVRLSAKDKAKGVAVAETGRTAESSKGYRTVRGTHGVASGAWYCEAHIERLGDTGHARLGWCATQSNLCTLQSSACLSHAVGPVLAGQAPRRS